MTQQLSLTQEQINNRAKQRETGDIIQYTEQEINQIINLKGTNDQTINLFNMHGALYIGDKATEDNYTQYSEHTISLNIDDFSNVYTPEDIKERFTECIKEVVCEKIL